MECYQRLVAVNTMSLHKLVVNARRKHNAVGAGGPSVNQVYLVKAYAVERVLLHMLFLFDESAVNPFFQGDRKGRPYYIWAYGLLSLYN